MFGFGGGGLWMPFLSVWRGDLGSCEGEGIDVEDGRT